MSVNKKLYTRTDFRQAVFERDKHKCVICGLHGQDAHHVMERRLWVDGGYYLENGATLCGTCHLEAEKTTLTVEQICEAIGVKHVLLPPHLYSDHRYDKWGNIIMPNGQRLPGELFNDESVQKVLAGITFTRYIKYPRTFHFGWSNPSKDDRVLDDLSGFIGKQVVATIKMDGENCTMYNDHIHARSIDSGNHPSRNRVKALWASIAHDIPENYRICGENLYAKHSIYYEDLPSYFEVFSVWKGLVCLSWTETKEWASLLGLETVPVIYEGIWDETIIRNLYVEGTEGYVVRVADSFDYKDFRKVVGKFVRKNHLQTHGHWMRTEITPNKLKA